MSSHNLMTALALASNGFHVFPCRGTDGDDGKQPLVAWRGDSTTDPDKIGRWFQRWPGATLGLDLAKSGLFVVDCDQPKAAGQIPGQQWLEARIAENGAEDYPFITCRTPSGGIHYVFRQPDGEPLRNARGGLPKKAEVAIDVRGDGGFIIAPGALMQDGRRYVLDGDLRDAPALPGWLLDVLRKADTVEAAPAAGGLPTMLVPASEGRVAAYANSGFESEVAEVRNAPKGTRNETLNSSAFKIGTMVGAGWVPESHAYTALVAAVTGWDNQHKTIDTLRRALREGMGKPREGLPAEIVIDPAAVIAPLLQRYDTGDLVDTNTGELIEAAPIKTGDLKIPPGLVGEITHWILDCSRRPQPLLALGAALSIVGTVIGRKVAGPTLSGTHLYVVGLAPTGAGKDRPLSACKRVLAAAGMHKEIGGSEFISMPAVINAVKDWPCSLWAIDEFGSFFSRINSRRASGFEAAITGMLRKLWGSSFELFKTPEWANIKSVPVESPALSIFGVSTPEEFYGSLEGADITNGVLNRLLVLAVEDRPPEREPLCDHRVVWPTIIEQLKKLYFILGETATGSQATSDSEPKPLQMGWGAGASEFRAALVREVEDRSERSPDEAPFLARVAEYAVRIATIVAAGRGATNVDLADMEFGRDLAMRSAGDVIAGAAGYMAETENQANANMILRALKGREGISQSTLTRVLKNKLRYRELNDLMAQLVQGGQVAFDKSAGLYSLGA